MKPDVSLPVIVKSGPKTGQRAVISGFRAGRVFLTGSDGSTFSTRPDELTLSTGATGDDLLALLLPRPHVSDLFHGSVREALAAVHSIAMLGRQDTRAWDQPNLYIVDDNEGNAGVIKFVHNGCVAAMSSHDPVREFDQKAATLVAPIETRNELTAVCTLPFFDGPISRITAVFWSEHEIIHGPEPWHVTYQFGAEIFHRELLNDEAWASEAGKHYSLSTELTTMIVRVAGRRQTVQQMVVLTPYEQTLLAPPAAPHCAEALRELSEGGVFMATS